MTKLNLNDLNPPQREAVCHDDGPLLVLAGAGSGKTRVVTYRIARLILEKGLPASRILAVTFTNKAAREMSNRIEELAGDRSQGLWIGTFHAMCARILRRHADRIGYARDFTIYATDEQRQVIKKIVSDLNLDPNLWKPADVNSRISRAKSHLITPDRLAEEKGRRGDAQLAEIYRVYQETLKRAGALDFDDLLNFCVVLFSDHEDVLSQYQIQFEHVIVDEYQDSNEPQDVLTRVLSLPQNNLCVVGDDDQSIYRWRGAQFKNILNLPKVYKNLKVVRLEENYRSTPNILNAAHAVISQNKDRHEKKIWTGRGEGEPIRLFSAENEEVEAVQTAQRIREAIEEKVSPGEIAVLYRTNAQSRAIEEALVRARIPYKVVGGYAFYQRKEVRDLLSYLRLLIRPHDDAAFLRVVNTPKRGIGQTTLRQLQSMAGTLRLSLYETAKNAGAHGEIGSAGSVKLQTLVRSVQGWARKLESRPLADTLAAILRETDYEDWLRSDETAKAEARIENVKELGTALAVAESEIAFEAVNPWDGAEAPEPPSRARKLEVFLERATLESDAEDRTERNDVVSLMTLHAAKGLEFDRVFITGMEEGVLPHANSAETREGFEEERRLCYVGMTRAKNLLTLSYCHNRRIFGSSTPMRQSTFLREIPVELLDSTDAKPLDSLAVRMERAARNPARQALIARHQRGGKGRKPQSSSAKKSAPPMSPDPAEVPAFLHPGQSVRHRTFGLGRVVRTEGAEPALKVTVDFRIVGTKTVVQKFAKLEPA